MGTIFTWIIHGMAMQQYLTNLTSTFSTTNMRRHYCQKSWLYLLITNILGKDRTRPFYVLEDKKKRGEIVLYLKPK
jgi:hypothetical protein